MTVEELIDILVSEPRGQIIIANIVDGLDQKVFDEAFLGELLQAWCGHHRTSGLGNEIDAVLDSIQDFHYPLTDPDPGSYHFRCADAVKPPADAELSTVLLAELVLSAVDPSDRARLRGRHHLFGASSALLPISASGVADARALPDRERRARVKKGAAFPVQKGVLWFTKREKIFVATKSKKGPADAARDALGLIHRKPREQLIAVHFKGTDLAGNYRHKPSFADANTHRRFKSSRQRSGQAAAWGAAVDLDRLARRQDKIDGAPEGICQALAAGCTIVLEPLGEIEVDRGESSYDNDAAFATKLLNGRSVRDLAMRVSGAIRCR